MPWCMLFAHNIVLVGESREEINKKLELWRKALEAHDFPIIRNKAEWSERWTDRKVSKRWETKGL